jgi:hypothetical protein
MELKVWIWLIIVAGSFIVNAIKKRRQNASTTGRRASSANYPHGQIPSDTAPITTFEEMLKEIEGSRQRTTHANEIKPETPQLDKQRSNVRTKPAVLEDTLYDYRQHDTIYGIYENARKEAFERPSLEETLKLENTSVKFGAFRGYQKALTSNFAAEFASELKRPAGFKRAFLMNEILQRRF